MNPIDPLRNPSLHNNSAELHDIMDGGNYDQFFNLIRENEDQNSVGHFRCDDHHLTNGSFIDNQFGQTTPGYMFGFNANIIRSDANHVMLNNNAFPSFEGGKKEVPEEDINRTDDSSGASMKTTAKRGNNIDKLRTLISERRRRGIMKEKLYALRALVPNITKMDKASIVGDAMQYVQELQMQAKKLKTEIAGLEASLVGPAERYQGYNIRNTGNTLMANTSRLISKKIIQMDMFQVEEREFYVKLVSNKGKGVAASLYKVLESLVIFNVQNSNLTTASESLVLKVTMKVKECEQEIKLINPVKECEQEIKLINQVKECEHEINLPNMKLYVIGALLNEGFELV